jgi:hypothetical protein
LDCNNHNIEHYFSPIYLSSVGQRPAYRQNNNNNKHFIAFWCLKLLKTFLTFKYKNCYFNDYEKFKIRFCRKNYNSVNERHILCMKQILLSFINVWKSLGIGIKVVAIEISHKSKNYLIWLWGNTSFLICENKFLNHDLGIRCRKTKNINTAKS